MARGHETEAAGQESPGAAVKSKKRTAPVAKPDRVRKAMERQIDEFVKSTGAADPAQRTDPDGWRWFEYGSLRARAGIVEASSDGALYLRTESLVMEVPPDKDEAAALLRELMEANMHIAGPARLAVSGDGVFVCSTIPVAALAVSDVPSHIEAVVALAGKLFGETGQGEPPPEISIG